MEIVIIIGALVVLVGVVARNIKLDIDYRTKKANQVKDSWPFPVNESELEPEPVKVTKTKSTMTKKVTRKK